MERFTSLASSRGILKTCTARNAKPESSKARIDADLLERHSPYGSIYVCTEALRLFAREFLPRIRQPFVLVSGDSDLHVTDELLADSTVRTILASEFLTIWYAQNLTAVHPRVEPLPIGLDYHSMWEQPGRWAMRPLAPMAQEHALVRTLDQSPEFTHRFFNAYCNWQFVINCQDRVDCLNTVDRSLCLFEPQPVPKMSTWTRQAECMFVVSPQGNGLDCHRTWEALVLGCIPIVRRDALTRLLADLPVLVIDQWKDLTRDLLIDFASKVGARKFDYSSLFLAHWTRTIAGLPSEPVLGRLTPGEFRALLTRRTG